MNNSIENACTEVLEVLKILPESEMKKIPKEEIEYIESKKNTNYKIDVDLIEKLNISREAKAILVVLWDKYFASEIQRKKLEIILKQNSIEREKKGI